MTSNTNLNTYTNGGCIEGMAADEVGVVPIANLAHEVEGTPAHTTLHDPRGKNATTMKIVNYCTTLTLCLNLNFSSVYSIRFRTDALLLLAL